MSQLPSNESKTVLLSGASGLVGRALSPWLLARGHRVRRLVRRTPTEAGEYLWDPAAGQIDLAALAGVNAVINLAGETLPRGAGPPGGARRFCAAGSMPRARLSRRSPGWSGIRRCSSMHRPDCNGPINAVTPGTVTNAEFTATLGTVLHRPVVLPVPAFVLRALFGRMADEALLASTRVMPGQLLRSGYVFRFPQLEPALRHVVACKT